MPAKSQQRVLRSRVRKRLVAAVSDLHPDVEIVRVRAWATDEARAAGRRWVADQRNAGEAGHDAFLVIIKRDGPGSRRRDPAEAVPNAAIGG